MPVVPPLDSDRYLSYQGLAEYLRAVEQAVPHLVRLFTIGSSYEGRPLLLAEVTNRGTREGLEKPAIWLDGNLHAPELASSMACLEVLRVLASAHGRDEFVTDLLDNCTFYICPRLSPDAAERCLTRGELIRSATRPYPFEENPRGLVPADVDGDGWIRQMRIQDPLGEWKVSKRDPRLLVRRAPDDREGPFYRLYREGYIEGGASGPVQLAPDRFRLDFDENFPFQWKHDVESRGGGPFPLSESETRAIADFFRTHPNLFCALSCHTFGGMILQPQAGSRAMPGEDAELYEMLGSRMAEVSGYSFEQAASEGATELRRNGSFQDWIYESTGVLAFRCQLWSLPRAAGLDVSEPSRLLGSRSEIENVTVLRWLDRECEGRGFSAWRPFEHPQLGQVEIGGWDVLNTWLNPPPGPLLKAEMEKYAKLVMALAATCPRLAVHKVDDAVLGYTEGGRTVRVNESPNFGTRTPGPAAEGAADRQPLRRIRLEIENQGFLSTWVTRRALQDGSVAPLEVRVAPADDVSLLMGQAVARVGQLAGSSTAHLVRSQDAVWFEGVDEQQRLHLEWLVQGEGEVAFELHHDRAGCLRFSSRIRPDRAIPVAPPAPPVRAPVAPLTPPPSVFPTVSAETAEGAFPRRATPVEPVVPSSPAAPATPAASAFGQAPSQPTTARPGPFPDRPTSGRVFGAPPPKPGPTFKPRPLAKNDVEPEPAAPPPAAYMAGQAKEFTPASLSRQSEFEPFTPSAAPPNPASPGSLPRRAPSRPAEPPPSSVPPDSDFPEAPPPRVSRIPAPLLLRRQKGSRQ